MGQATSRQRFVGIKPPIGVGVALLVALTLRTARVVLWVVGVGQWVEGGGGGGGCAADEGVGAAAEVGPCAVGSFEYTGAVFEFAATSRHCGWFVSIG